MATTTRKVLIVDDDPWVGKLVEFVARDLGYEPLLARDGAEALERYAEELPDVVVADVVLPKVDGLEVCRRVKSTGPGAFTPVLVVSGIYRSEKEALKRFRADSFFQKPLSPEVLQRRMGGLFPPPFEAPANAVLGPPENGEVGLDFEPLPRALARLFQKKKTGILRVRVKGTVAQFYVREGRLTFAKADGWSEGISQILLRAQRLTPEQRAHLEKLVTEKGDPTAAGDLAIKEGYVTPDELVRLVSNQIVHRVLEAFRWTEGYHRFEEGPLPAGAKSALDLDAPSLLHWGLRRGAARPEDVDDFLAARDAPLVRNSEADTLLRTLPLSRAEKWLLERADGSASFGDLLLEVPPADTAAVEAVRRAAMALSALGAIIADVRPAAPAQPPAAARDSIPPTPALAPRAVQGTVCGLLLELWRRQHTGLLQFDAPGGQRTFHVTKGQVVWVRVGEGEKLETLLARRGKIRQEVAAQIRMIPGRSRNIGDVLVELQAIAAPQLQQFVRSEIKAALRELVRHRELPATFVPGPWNEEEIVRHEWDLAAAVFEAVRGQDLAFVRAQLPAAGVRVQREPRAAEISHQLPLFPNERNLLNLVASAQPWERLQQVDLVTAEDQQRALWVLLATGLVRTLQPGEAVASTPAPARARPAPSNADADPLAGIDPSGEEDVIFEGDEPPARRPDEEVLIEISAASREAPLEVRLAEPLPAARLNRSNRDHHPPPPAPAPSAAPGPVARGSYGRTTPARTTGGRQNEEMVPRAMYEEIVAARREVEKRLFALLDQHGSGEMVPRALFDQVQAEKAELKSQLVQLLDEVIRLKNAAGFSSPSLPPLAPPAPPPAPSRRTVSFALGDDSDGGGVMTVKRSRS